MNIELSERDRKRTGPCTQWMERTCKMHRDCFYSVCETTVRNWCNLGVLSWGFARGPCQAPKKPLRRRISCSKTNHRKGPVCDTVSQGFDLQKLSQADKLVLYWTLLCASGFWTEVPLGIQIHCILRSSGSWQGSSKTEHHRTKMKLQTLCLKFAKPRLHCKGMLEKLLT